MRARKPNSFSGKPDENVTHWVRAMEKHLRVAYRSSEHTVHAMQRVCMCWLQFAARMSAACDGHALYAEKEQIRSKSSRYQRRMGRDMQQQVGRWG